MAIEKDGLGGHIDLTSAISDKATKVKADSVIIVLYIVFIIATAFLSFAVIGVSVIVGIVAPGVLVAVAGYYAYTRPHDRYYREGTDR